MFWIITIVLSLLAAAFVVLPLWQAQRSTDSDAERLRRSANITIFDERRQELDSDLAAGNISQGQYDSLLVELKRSLLSDIDSAALQATAAPQTSPLVRWLPAGMMLLMLVMAYPMYSLWGFLDEVSPSELYEQTFANVENDPEVARQLAIQLGAVVQRDTDNPWAWYFLARNFSTLGRFNEAEIAFQQAIGYLEEGPDKAAVLGQYATRSWLS